MEEKDCLLHVIRVNFSDSCMQLFKEDINKNLLISFSPFCSRLFWLHFQESSNFGVPGVATSSPQFIPSSSAASMGKGFSSLVPKKVPRLAFIGQIGYVLHSDWPRSRRKENSVLTAKWPTLGRGVGKPRSSS